jgi:hypothetical protein
VILKLPISPEEVSMTELAHEQLGSVVPHVDAFVTIVEPCNWPGMVMTRQPGEILVDVWPNLDSKKREKVKQNLVALLVRMRAPDETHDYYGRPGQQPFMLMDGEGTPEP